MPERSSKMSLAGLKNYYKACQVLIKGVTPDKRTGSISHHAPFSKQAAWTTRLVSTGAVTVLTVDPV